MRHPASCRSRPEYRRLRRGQTFRARAFQLHPEVGGRCILPAPNRCQVDIVPIGFEVRFAKRTKEPSLSLTVEVMCEGKLTWSEHRLGDCRITGLDISETFVKIAPGTHSIFLWCSPLNEMTIPDRVMQKLHEETAQQPTPTQERKQRRSRVTG